MVPAVAACEPDKTLSKVVLPAPFGPTMPMASPRRHLEVHAVENDQCAVLLAHSSGKKQCIR